MHVHTFWQEWKIVMSDRTVSKTWQSWYARNCTSKLMWWIWMLSIIFVFGIWLSSIFNIWYIWYFCCLFTLYLMFQYFAHQVYLMVFAYSIGFWCSCIMYIYIMFCCLFSWFLMFMYYVHLCNVLLLVQLVSDIHVLCTSM
jgi:hypothetical protein